MWPKGWHTIFLGIISCNKPEKRHNTALYAGGRIYTTCQWIDRRGERGTELPGKLHSTAPPGNNTTSRICAMIHSAHRGEKRGGGGSQMTLAQSPRNEWKRGRMNETYSIRGDTCIERGTKTCRSASVTGDYEILGTLFQTRFRSLFRSHPPFAGVGTGQRWFRDDPDEEVSLRYYLRSKNRHMSW